MTKAELMMMDDIEFAIRILQDKLAGCMNRYTPMATKLKRSIVALTEIREDRKNGAHGTDV